MILIWSDTGGWGGVDILIMRYAEHLRREGRSFAIAEREGSRLRQDIPWATFIDPLKTHDVARQVTRVFMPSVAKLRSQRFPWAAFVDTPLFAWLVQPNDPLTQFVPFADAVLERFGYSGVRPLSRALPGHFGLVRDLFRLLVEGGSLAVMDAACQRALAFFFPNAKAEEALLVPVPAPLGDPINAQPLSSQELVIGYLGRMDSMKWSALGPLVETELKAIASTLPVRLVAICEGDKLAQLDSACRQSGVAFESLGYMPNSEARAYLRQRTHFAVAMGTAALDLAAAGHPCVVIDPAMHRAAPPQKLFRFIHEAEGFTLGEFRDFPFYQHGLRTFSDATEMALNNNVTEAVRSYVKESHNPKACFDSIDHGIDVCAATVGEINAIRDRISRSYDEKYRLYGYLRGRSECPVFRI